MTEDPVARKRRSLISPLKVFRKYEKASGEVAKDQNNTQRINGQGCTDTTSSKALTVQIDSTETQAATTVIVSKTPDKIAVSPIPHEDVQLDYDLAEMLYLIEQQIGSHETTHEPLILESRKLMELFRKLRKPELSQGQGQPRKTSEKARKIPSLRRKVKDTKANEKGEVGDTQKRAVGKKGIKTKMTYVGEKQRKLDTCVGDILQALEEVQRLQTDLWRKLKDARNMIQGMKMEVLEMNSSGKIIAVGDETALTNEMRSNMETLKETFLKELGNSFYIFKIEYIRNAALSEKFAKTKEALQRLEKPSNEVLLFHGTRDKNIDRFLALSQMTEFSILRDGFKIGGREIASDHGDFNVSLSLSSKFNCREVVSMGQ